MQYIYIVHDINIYEEHVICQQYGLLETLTLSRQGLHVLKGFLVQFRYPKHCTNIPSYTRNSIESDLGWPTLTSKAVIMIPLKEWCADHKL
jgi:hypothetical protein